MRRRGRGNVAKMRRMKFLSFRRNGEPTAGLLVVEGVLPLAEAGSLAGEKVDLSSVLAIVRGGEPALQACRRLARRATEGHAALIAVADAPLLAPIPILVRNAFCVGRNYLDHIKEGAATLKT